MKSGLRLGIVFRVVAVVGVVAIGMCGARSYNVSFKAREARELEVAEQQARADALADQ